MYIYGYLCIFMVIYVYWPNLMHASITGINCSVLFLAGMTVHCTLYKSDLYLYVAWLHLFSEHVSKRVYKTIMFVTVNIQDYHDCKRVQDNHVCKRVQDNHVCKRVQDNHFYKRVQDNHFCNSVQGNHAFNTLCGHMRFFCIKKIPLWEYFILMYCRVSCKYIAHAHAQCRIMYNTLVLTM